MKLNSNTFDSNDTSCYHSLSPPSEPPHIGKWFSSYEYDSPEMNLGEAGDPFISRDAQLSKLKTFDKESTDKIGEDNVDPERSRKRKIVKTCYKNNSSELNDNGRFQHDYNSNQMNADSLSPPSEPPDIRNWFSSYVYESPELDSGADLNISLFKEIQRDQQDIGIKQKGVERENNLKYERTSMNVFGVDERDGLADIIESPLESYDQKDLSFTDSLPSVEPPDIRNWFSSYAYESPALFTDGELRNLVVPEVQSGKSDQGVERNGGKANHGIHKSSTVRNKTSIHDKDAPIDLTPHSNHSNPDNQLGNYSAEGSGKNNDCFPILSDLHCTTGIGMAKIVDEADCVPWRNPRRLFPRKNLSESWLREEVSGVLYHKKKPDSVKGSRVEDKKERADKENEETDVREKGLISTKKIRKVMLNPLQRHEDHYSIRRGMSNVTNMQHSTEVEISGKWKCPQRSKANLGPTLRQLRLEQWVMSYNSI